MRHRRHSRGEGTWKGAGSEGGLAVRGGGGNQRGGGGGDDDDADDSAHS